MFHLETLRENSLVELVFCFISKGMQNDCFHLYRHYCVRALFSRWKDPGKISYCLWKVPQKGNPHPFDFVKASRINQAHFPGTAGFTSVGLGCAPPFRGSVGLCCLVRIILTQCHVSHYARAFWECWLATDKNVSERVLADKHLKQCYASALSCAVLCVQIYDGPGSSSKVEQKVQRGAPWFAKTWRTESWPSCSCQCFLKIIFTLGAVTDNIFLKAVFQTEETLGMDVWSWT